MMQLIICWRKDLKKILKLILALILIYIILFTSVADINHGKGLLSINTGVHIESKALSFRGAAKSLGRVI
jgi:hypothetical protein